METNEQKVLDIIEGLKAAYRKQAYEKAGLSEEQVKDAVENLAKQGLVKINKRGAVARVGGPNQAAARRKLNSMRFDGNGFD